MSESFEMNRLDFCRGSSFYVGWMRGVLYTITPSLHQKQGCGYVMLSWVQVNVFITLTKGLGETTRTLVPWRQGFRHLTRNECMGWFAQTLPKGTANR